MPWPLGLDTPEGLPVDVYFTCAEKEIQLTVEASRDSKTHTLHAIGLLPGLCSVPEDGKSYFVLPIGEGAMVFPSDISDQPLSLPLWSVHHGLTMPFLGAVRGNYPPAPDNCPPIPDSAPLPPGLGELPRLDSPKPGGRGAGLSSSVLCLITDSAYASARLSKTSCDWEYARDPERRRLEIRLVLIPGGDHVAIARAYRDKLVGERAHVTLRKKIRERPILQEAVGSVLTSQPGMRELLYGIEVERVFVIPHPIAAVMHLPSGERWQEIEVVSERLKSLEKVNSLIRSLGNPDWIAPFADFWEGKNANQTKDFDFVKIPLMSVVYHDSVIFPEKISGWQFQQSVLRALLQISPPYILLMDIEFGEPGKYWRWKGNDVKCFIASSLLCPLHRLSFSSFLIEHRFLMPGFLVEEAIYSNKTRVVINQNQTETYETEEFSLPPLGFYVNSPQMVLHDASRVGDEVFSERAWRVSRKSEAGEWTREEFPLGENLRGPI